MSFDKTKFAQTCANEPANAACTIKIVALVTEAERLQTVLTQVNLQSNGKDTELNKAKVDLQTQTDQNKAKAAQIMAKDKEIAKVKEDLKAKTVEN